MKAYTIGTRIHAYSYYLSIYTRKDIGLSENRIMLNWFFPRCIKRGQKKKIYKHTDNTRCRNFSQPN